MSTDATEPTLAPDLSSLQDAVEAHDAATPAPEPTPEPSEPTPEPPTPAPEPVVKPEPAPEQADEGAVRDFITARHPGFDVSKFKTDVDMLDGFVNASRMVGVRDADAELGKAIRASGRETEISALLSGQQPQPVPPQPSQPTVGSYDEYKLLQSQIKQDEDGNLIALPNAPLDAVQRYRAATEQMQRAQFDLAHQPEQLLQPIVQQQAAALQQQVQQQFAQHAAQQQQQGELRAWAEQSKPWLFNNGDPNQGISATGQQFAKHFDESGEPTPAGKMRYADAMMRGQQPPTPPAAPSPQAVHKPGVATPPAVDPDEEYKKRVETMSLLDHLVLAQADQEAASGVAK